MSELFISSESLQRQHSIDVFARQEAERKKETVPEETRYMNVIEKYIKLHSNTASVRKIAVEMNRDNGYQLDVSADIVAVLEKIKNELRR